MCTNWGRGPPLRPCGIVGFRSVVYQLFWQLFASVGGGGGRKKTSLLPPLHLWAKPLRGVEQTRGGEQKAILSPFPHFLFGVCEGETFFSFLFSGRQVMAYGEMAVGRAPSGGFFWRPATLFPFSLYGGGGVLALFPAYGGPHTPHTADRRQKTV